MIVTQPDRRSFFLYPGQMLTVSADANSAGIIRRLGDHVGDAIQGSWSIAASGSQSWGPFTDQAIFELEPSAGSLTGTIGVASAAQISGGASAFIYRGAIDCSANPSWPAANAGDVYKVSVAGKIGGASGKAVQAGDVLTCNATGIAGTDAAVGANWMIEQGNVVSTADVPDTTDKRYVTDAQRTVIGNTSGANTGDQTSTSGLTDSTDKRFVTDAQRTVIGNTSGANTGDHITTVVEAETASSITPCPDGTVTPVTSITTVKGIITAIS